MNDYDLQDLREDFKKLKREIQSSMENTVNWGDKVTIKTNVEYYIDRFEFSFANKLNELMTENAALKKKYCSGEIKLINIRRETNDRNLQQILTKVEEVKND